MTDTTKTNEPGHRQRETEQAIKLCLRENYAIEGELQRLGGENLNYLVTQQSGQKDVFKVVDDDMPPEVVEMEFELFAHVEKRGFELKLPKIRLNRRKQIETRINLPIKTLNRSRLIDFLSGIEMETISDISTILLKSVGKSLAQFDLALEKFDHPAAHRTHRWDLANAGQHKKKTSFFCDRQKRQVLDWAYLEWENKAKPQFEHIPWQVIHGDANQGNILVEDDQVIGLVDFGDVCYNPAICELGICLPYMMMGQGDPIAAANTVIKSYTALKPLSDEELSLLFPLACARLAVTMTVAEERRRIDPHNPTWFGTAEPAWQLLSKLYSEDAHPFSS